MDIKEFEKQSERYEAFHKAAKMDADKYCEDVDDDLTNYALSILSDNKGIIRFLNDQQTKYNQDINIRMRKAYLNDYDGNWERHITGYDDIQLYLRGKLI